jgi:hypothetical protein
MRLITSIRKSAVAFFERTVAGQIKKQEPG